MDRVTGQPLGGPSRETSSLSEEKDQLGGIRVVNPVLSASHGAASSRGRLLLTHFSTRNHHQPQKHKKEGRAVPRLLLPLPPHIVHSEIIAILLLLIIMVS